MRRVDDTTKWWATLRARAALLGLCAEARPAVDGKPVFVIAQHGGGGATSVCRSLAELETLVATLECEARTELREQQHAQALDDAATERAAKFSADIDGIAARIGRAPP